MSRCLNAGGMGRQDFETETLIPTGGGFEVAHSLKAEGFDASEDGTGRGVPLVADTLRNHPRPGSNSMGACISVGLGSDPLHAKEVAQPITNRRGDPGVVAFSSKDHGADVGKTSPTLLAGGHAGSHANAGVPPAVAFTQNQAGDILSGDVTASMGTNQNATGRNTPKAMLGLQVRRLTPRECERLQGFPTYIDRIIIRACFDNDGTRLARAEIRYLKSLTNALPVEDVGKGEYAPPVDVTFWNDRVSREAVVAVHVRVSSGAKVERISSRGKCVWSAAGATQANSFPLPIPKESIALGIAHLVPCLAQLIFDGEAVSPMLMPPSTHPESGNWSVVTFGPESEVSVSDAAKKLIAAMRSTTKKHGHDTHNFGSTERTLLSSVIVATTSFIPRQTLSAPFCDVVIDLETDYTLVKYRGKPASDGSRYKALGNSMAVPVMSWIGERIEMVRLLTNQ